MFFLASFTGTLTAKDCIPNIDYEMIKNGDFEMGDTLFYTEYINAAEYMRPSRTYAVSTNPQDNYDKFDSCGDHTTGHTNMLVINGDTTAGTVVWMQKVRNIKPGTDYEFSFWFTVIDSLRPATLIVLINGDTLEPWPIWMSDSTCLWSEMKYIWNSGASDTAEIRIYDINLAFFGNDFALDDISMMPYCRLQACAGKNVSTCKNVPVTLSGNAMDGFPPYRYKWSPSAGLDNPNIQNPRATIDVATEYILEVSDARNCTSYDTITVEVYDEPISTILSSPSMPACPCEPVTLIAAIEYYDYYWSTGETTRSIIVRKPGIYSLTVEDKNGCRSSSDFELVQRDVSVNVAIDSISTETGKEIKLYLLPTDEQNLTDCGYSSYTAKIKYNASLLIPRKDTPFGTVENGFETISVSGDLKNATNEPLNFYTLWGNAECTDISIDEITFSCDSVNVNTTPGKVCLTNLCNAGGLRLFDAGTELMMKVSAIDKLINVEINTKQDANITLQLYNYLGAEINTLIQNEHIKKGTKSWQFPVSNLSPGVYFLILSSNENPITRSIIIQ